MNMCKYSLLLGAAAVAAGCTTAAPPSAPLIESSKHMLIEVKQDQPGLSLTLNDPKTFDGFETQLARQAAESFQREADLRATVSEHREQSLVDGKADAVIASFSMTPDRKSEVDMVGPYLRTKTGILVREGYSGPTDISGFQTNRICTSKGTTTIQLIKDATGGSDLRDEPNFKSCEEKLRENVVDAIVTDKIILKGLAAQSGGDFKVLPSDFGPDQYYGIAIPQGYPKECAQLKDWLQNFVASPEWRRNFQLYFPGLDPNSHAVNSTQVAEHTACSSAKPAA